MNVLRAQGLRLLLSIGLAFALWIFVSFTQNPDQHSSFEGVPVDIEGLAPGLVMVDKEGLPRANRSTVDITAEGDEATIQTVRQSDLRAFVDLSGLGAGEHSNVPVIVERNRTGLARLTLTADPSFLSFRLEQEITRTVPLTIEITGNVPFSFEKGDPHITSQNQPISSVQVHGPQSRVQRVARARVVADIDRLTANYSSPRPVEALAQDGQPLAGVTVEPSSVDVLVPIVSSAGIKRVPVVPLLVGAPASGYIVGNMTINPQFVRLTGGSGSLNSIMSIGTLDVDIAGASRTFTRTVQLSVPPNTSLASGEPDTATVQVEIQAIERMFQVTLPVPIQVNDIPAGVLMSYSPQTVQVTVRGSAADLAHLDAASLQGSISLRGLGEGSFPLTPTFQLPRGISLVGTAPRITVNLRLPATLTPTATPAPPTAPPSETPVITSVPAPPAETPAPPTPTP